MPQESYGYRLLSEAEWEYVARAGQRTTYAGSSTANDVAWVKHNSRKHLQPVALRITNTSDLHDCSGIVCEWCKDSWHPEAYTRRISALTAHEGQEVIDPIVLEAGEGGEHLRVTRSGYWSQSSHKSQVSVRDYFSCTIQSKHISFRVVRVFRGR